MTEALAIEVLGGPMDGVRLTLGAGNKVFKIGRQVGNSLSLAVDMTVSRWHAEIRREGGMLYLVDANSGSGTWCSGERVTRKELQPGSLLLFGGTVAEVDTSFVFDENVTIGEECFRNPVEIYQMSPEVSAAWDRLNSGEGGFGYCDVTQFMRQLLLGDETLLSYGCIEKICSLDHRHILSEWIASLNITPLYRIPDGEHMITAPRMWGVFDMASDGNSREITRDNLIDAVMGEKRSVPARAMLADPDFIRSLSGDNKVEKIYRSQSDVTEMGALLEDKNASISEHKDPHGFAFLYDHLRDFEKIVTGFAEDAVCSGMSAKDFHIPGLEEDLEGLWDHGAPGPLCRYLENLNKNLIAVLAAHRDAFGLYGAELNGRVRAAMDQFDKNQKSLFRLPHTNKKAGDVVKGVLKDTELENLAHQIIRKEIKKKILP